MQFKPGKSGNPKGRPKGSSSVGAILKKVIGQKVAVTENGKKRWIPGLELMLRRLANDAMRSDRNAIKLLLPLIERYLDSPDANAKIGNPDETNPNMRTVVILPSNGREVEREPE